jgi:hypothetical protein
MSDKEFRANLAVKRLERQRKEAEAANGAQRKPPTSAKSRKIKRTCSA